MCPVPCAPLIKREQFVCLCVPSFWVCVCVLSLVVYVPHVFVKVRRRANVLYLIEVGCVGWDWGGATGQQGGPKGVTQQRWGNVFAGHPSAVLMMPSSFFQRPLKVAFTHTQRLLQGFISLGLSPPPGAPRPLLGHGGPRGRAVLSAFLAQRVAITFTLVLLTVEGHLLEARMKPDTHTYV